MCSSELLGKKHGGKCSNLFFSFLFNYLYFLFELFLRKHFCANSFSFSNSLTSNSSLSPGSWFPWLKSQGILRALPSFSPRARGHLDNLSRGTRPRLGSWGQMCPAVISENSPALKGTKTGLAFRILSLAFQRCGLFVLPLTPKIKTECFFLVFLLRNDTSLSEHPHIFNLWIYFVNLIYILLICNKPFWLDKKKVKYTPIINAAVSLSTLKYYVACAVWWKLNKILK